MTGEQDYRELEVKPPKLDGLALRKARRWDEATQYYAAEFRRALSEGDEYVAQACVEQLGEMLGEMSSKKDWSAPQILARDIEPQIRRILTKGSPEGDRLVDQLLQLARIKFTSDEFRPSRALRGKE